LAELLAGGQLADDDVAVAVLGHVAVGKKLAVASEGLASDGAPGVEVLVADGAPGLSKAKGRENEKGRGKSGPGEAIPCHGVDYIRVPARAARAL
jgi:hypothetical protein